jgi:hypothetical protein
MRIFYIARIEIYGLKDRRIWIKSFFSNFSCNPRLKNNPKSAKTLANAAIFLASCQIYLAAIIPFANFVPGLNFIDFLKFFIACVVKDKS